MLLLIIYALTCTTLAIELHGQLVPDYLSQKKPRSVEMHEFEAKGGGGFVEARMVLSPRDSAVLMVIKDVPEMPSANPEDWQHINPRASTQFDYEGLVTARSQKAHIASGNSTVYIYLINFEETATPSFSLKIS
jgi:hypothetical protein